MTNVTIEPLYRHATLTEAVARLIHAEFWEESGAMTVADLVNHLHKTHDPARLPLCLIALRGGELAGTINLIDNDDKQRTHLHPWLAALVVVPGLRGSGIGTRLVRALLDEARRLGFAAVYFGTDGPGFYTRLGAQMHEQVSSDFLIMRFALDRRIAPPNPRAEYANRMHRVFEHIDRHLDQALDLASLAEVAHFSPFHFHRLFAAWMGETLGDYLRRRRLEVAATRLLAQPRVPVLHIALSVGFGSGEAFTRAFRSRFACSPTAWRLHRGGRRDEKSNPDQAVRNIDQAAAAAVPEHGASSNHVPESAMNVKLVDRPPVTIAYLRHVGPYGEPVGRFWDRVVHPWLVTNGLLDQPRYGISHDDPGVSAPDQCRYDACAEVPPSFVATGNALKTALPGGRYAVLGFEGTAAQIGAAWQALLRDWLPGSGLQLDARPCFEHYPRGSRFDPQTGVFDCEICIPVAPL